MLGNSPFFKEEEIVTASTTAKPKISVNELGKYLDTPDDLKRKDILKKQKEQNSNIGGFWNEAEKVISKFFTEEMGNEDFLVSAIDKLHAESTYSTQGETKKRCNIEAISKFHGMLANLPAFDMACQKAPAKGWKIDIDGVTINIRPEILLAGNNTNGGIKLFFGGRSSKISIESVETIAALLHHGIIEKGMMAKQSACILIDVFG